MHRFFVDENEINEGQIYISGEDHIHITKSLRMKLGEKVEISNGKGTEFITELKEIGKDSVRLEILREFDNLTETSIQISLYQGIPKGPKMDLIIQKSVELGVKNIVPVVTHRTVVEIEKKGSKKIDRWQKISEEAAKQSKRGIIPQIRSIIRIMDMKNEFLNNDINLIAYEGEETVNLKQILIQNPTVKKIGILIGPEGGLAKEEVEFLKSLGGVPISLGDRILRTETAGIAVLSMLVYHFEMQI